MKRTRAVALCSTDPSWRTRPTGGRVVCPREGTSSSPPSTDGDRPSRTGAAGFVTDPGPLSAPTRIPAESARRDGSTGRTGRYRCSDGDRTGGVLRRARRSWAETATDDEATTTLGAVSWACGSEQGDRPSLRTSVATFLRSPGGFRRSNSEAETVRAGARSPPPARTRRSRRETLVPKHTRGTSAKVVKCRHNCRFRWFRPSSRYVRCETLPRLSVAIPTVRIHRTSSIRYRQSWFIE